MTDKTAILHKI